MAWLLAKAEQQPVLVAWEDLHWADASNLELLGLVLEQIPTVSMLQVPAFLAEALTLVDQREERFYEAEVYRFKGALLLQLSPDNLTEATAYFQKAITVAQNQQAKSWELRAVVSLARLWQSQVSRQEAYDLLAPIYDWFTEGFDTALNPFSVPEAERRQLPVMFYDL